eukprot:186210_1
MHLTSNLSSIKADKRYRDFVIKHDLLENLNCKFYGSMIGCVNGDNCPFSHANPESIPLCPYEPRCQYGDNCCFRHNNAQSNQQTQAQNNENNPLNKLIQAEQSLKSKNSLWHTYNSNEASEIFSLMSLFFNRKYYNKRKVFKMQSQCPWPDIAHRGTSETIWPYVGTYKYVLDAIQARFDGILIEELRQLYADKNCKSIIHSVCYDAESIQQFECFLKHCNFSDAILLDGRKYVCGYSNGNYKLQLIECKYTSSCIKATDFGYCLRFYDAPKDWTHGICSSRRLFDPQRLGLFNDIHVNNDKYYFDELLLEIERVKNNPYECICEYSFCEFWIDLNMFPNAYMALYDHYGWQWIKKTNLHKLGYDFETCRKQEKDITEWMEYYDKCKQELFYLCINHCGLYEDIVAIIVDCVM